MYPYHAKIRQRIRNGELVTSYYATDYPGIGECCVLVFSTFPYKRPIRPHKYAQYKDVLPRKEGGPE
ncbi:MAG: hypothetical protein EOM69_04305 [Clostridia bacterium]|nr:hypothetical protein [Clostridia bacterium]